MDGIIDIIIAVLFVAVPWLFKTIGNRLEKAGQTEKAGKFKKVAEALGSEEKKPAETLTEEDNDDSGNLWDWIKEAQKEIEEEKKAAKNPEPVVQPVTSVAEEGVQQIKLTPRPEASKSVHKKPSILLEEETKKKGEKIDPKKLVIYSEIMKPKY